MDRAVLEKRMIMLNAWLIQLTKPTIVEGHMGLQNLLLAFLEQGDYDKGVTGGQISRTVSLNRINSNKNNRRIVIFFYYFFNFFFSIRLVINKN